MALGAALVGVVVASLGLVSQDHQNAAAAATAPAACSIQNPVVSGGADPSVWYANGLYYLVESGGNSINLRSSPTIGGLGSASPNTIWSAPAGTDHSGDVWAPEIEFLNNQWIIYFAADAGTFDTHRIFALTANGGDPMGSWSFFGKIADSTDQWAIDPTVFFYNGNWWMLWSGSPANSNTQQIFIAHMSDPLHIQQDYRRLIANPDQPWETSVRPIEEGPEAFIGPNNTLTIVYNANASWTSAYGLGELRYHGGDMTNYTSYTKVGPVFSSANGVYGPGGDSLPVPGSYGGGWFIYHGNPSPSGGWAGRQLFAQPQTWNPDGTPNFGSGPAGINASFDENTGNRC